MSRQFHTNLTCTKKDKKGSNRSKRGRSESLEKEKGEKDHYGPELREADLVHAERVLREELQRRGWNEVGLGRRRKGDPEKIELASRLRARTPMTLKWIAQRLKMGAWSYVSNCLVHKRKNELQKHCFCKPLMLSTQ